MGDLHLSPLRLFQMQGKAMSNFARLNSWQDAVVHLELAAQKVEDQARNMVFDTHHHRLLLVEANCYRLAALELRGSAGMVSVAAREGTEHEAH
jgi:hypothetical protein